MPGIFGASEITPEGSVYTEFGEVGFAFGAGLRPYVQPQRRLAEGGLYPVIESSASSGGVAYTVSMLATPVDKVAIDVVRVRMRNLTGGFTRARWAVLVRRSGRAPADFRYHTAAGSHYAGTRFGVLAGAIVREAPGPRRAMVILAAGSERPTGGGCRAAGARCAAVSYSRLLGPGREAELEFKVPAIPVAMPSQMLARVAAVGYRAADAAVHRDFDGARVGAMRLALPEPAVADAYQASLVAIMESRYGLPLGPWAQTVNDLQYHAYWLRDAAIMTNALDLAGLHRAAAENLAFLPSWQRPDGLFISQAGQYDGIGEAVWSLGRHARLTGDAAFARAQLPAVGRAVAWIGGQLARDPLGLLPAGAPGDNEFLAGRLAGDDFWAVAGVDAAVDLARIAGATELQSTWQAVAGQLRGTVALAARAAAARNAGGVPPLLDRPGGRDWGNWWVAYPDGPLAPADPVVTATIRRAQARFREGIATYGGQLHDYTGFRIFETQLERGDQAAVVDGLYSELAHSTATFGGFETGIRPGAARSSATNLTPHGTYSGELVTLIRNMLVRDDGGKVVLLGAVPVGWLAPGKVIGVTDAPTGLGSVSFVLRGHSGGATLSWTAPPGTSLTWPVPYGVGGLRCTCGPVVGGALALPGSSGALDVSFTVRAGGPTLAARVDQLRRAYGARP